jgi:hypothetical protein
LRVRTLKPSRWLKISKINKPNSSSVFAKKKKKMPMSKSKFEFDHIRFSPYRNVRDVEVRDILSDGNGLRSLVLRNCHKITDDAFKVERRHTSLEVLCIYGCRNITDEGIFRICDIFPNIKKIDIRYIGNITRESVDRISRKLPGAFSFQDDTSISDAIIGSLFKNCTIIRELRISGSKALTDDGLRCLKSQYLKILDISKCDKITNEGFRSVVCNNGNMEQLYSTHIPFLTVKVFDTLKGNLKILDIRFCKSLNIENPSAIFSSFPHLRYLATDPSPSIRSYRSKCIVFFDESDEFLNLLKSKLSKPNLK